MHFWKSIKCKWLTDTQSRSCGWHLLWICGEPRRLKFKWIHWLQVYVPIFTSIVHAFVCSRIEYCNSLLICLPKTRLLPSDCFSPYIKESLHWLQISTRIEYTCTVVLIVLKAQMGVAPKYIIDAIRLPTSASSLRSVYAPWTGGSSLSLGLGQPWSCLHLFPLLTFLFGIAFQLQLVLLSYYPIFLRPLSLFKTCLFSWS